MRNWYQNSEIPYGARKDLTDAKADGKSFQGKGGGRNVAELESEDLCYEKTWHLGIPRAGTQRKML